MRSRDSVQLTGDERPSLDSPVSKIEAIKLGSRGLRGTLTEEINSDSEAFSESAAHLLKFHGSYQQDDRDQRRKARDRGESKRYQMMIRTRIPGGVVSPAAYLAHDQVAEEWGDRSLRVTTRQDFQLHGVLKGDLRSSLRRINAAFLSTLGGCGDVTRNVTFCSAPLRDPFRQEVATVVAELSAALTPVTGAYHEIWLDGEPTGATAPELEPLYGAAYLPRKFKIAVAVEGDNCVDVYSNDLGLVARRRPDGGLAGFEVLVGGGLGRTNNKPSTFPLLARGLGFVGVTEVVELARAVVSVQRDFGDRSNRRHARLKYLIHDRGLDWFRDRVAERLDFELRRPRRLGWSRAEDHLGWNQQLDGCWYLGIFVENGRIQDQASVKLRSALREIVGGFAPSLRLTCQQNLLLADLPSEARSEVDAVLAEHGVLGPDQISPVIRNSMACPALPTCGLALAEAERAMPALIRRISALLAELELADESISVRLTGCPNGCARPYLGDVGLVGTTLGKYDVFLGGDRFGTRLNQSYRHAVALEDIPEALRGPLTAFAGERRLGQSFGDWCCQAGMESLRQRFVTGQLAAASGVGLGLT